MTIELPAMVAMVMVLFNAGLAVGFFGSRFVTHAVCKQRMSDWQKTHEREHAVENEDRKAVWKKVDYLYEEAIKRQK